MHWVQLPQGYRATTGDSLLFTIKYPEIYGAHLIDLGWMKG